MADFEPQALLELLEAYPRFKDQALDPLRASAESGADAGALLIRGPSKLLHTLTKVTHASQAPTTAERFKPLLSRSRWVAASALADELSGAAGLKGLKDRLAMLGDARGDQFVAVVAVEGDDGALRCTHATCCGSTKVADSGPWLYVLDHGLDRTDRRPAFKYTGPWDHFVGLFLDGNVGQGSWFDHVLGWRTAKDDIGDRLLFLSFEDMKADVEAAVRRIAAFIDVPLDDALLAKVTAASSFDAMKTQHAARVESGAQKMGSATHFRSGTSGGWRANFTVDQSEALDAVFH